MNTVNHKLVEEFLTAFDRGDVIEKGKAREQLYRAFGVSLPLPSAEIGQLYQHRGNGDYYILTIDERSRYSLFSLNGRRWTDSVADKKLLSLEDFKFVHSSADTYLRQKGRGVT